VNRPIDCEAFQDQLDALSEGKLPEAGMEQLRVHAASCAECAVLLRMHEHLAAPPLRDLEAAVPDEVLHSVWSGVENEIAGRRRASSSASWLGRAWRWPVPVLAAASLVLFVASGLLYREVRQLSEREAVLTRRVTEQDRRLAELDVGTSLDPAARTARLAGRAVWERALSRQSSVSVAELRAVLRAVPANTTLFTTTESQALLGSVGFWGVTAAEAAFTRIDDGDGVQAGELLDLIDALNIDPERRIPTTRILSISRRAGRLGRS